MVVRDQYPEHFLEAHRALFAARHDRGLDLRDERVVADVLERSGVPADQVLAEVHTGAPIEEIRKVHEQAVTDWDVFGVPTFVIDGRAAFVRLMSRPEGDTALARRTIEGVLSLFDAQPDLNEYKFTKLER